MSNTDRSAQDLPDQLDPPAKVASNDQLGPVAEALRRAYYYTELGGWRGPEVGESERWTAVAQAAQEACRTKSLQDAARWVADKLHNGGDYGKEAAALLVHQAKELDYLRAAREDRKPAWVPARVWLAGPVRGDYPIGHTTIAHEGEYECQSNRYGAVSVVAEDGNRLGVKPAEFEVIAWRENKA